MAMSTTLTGPYDAFPTTDKIRMMAGIPSDIASELFPTIFPRRGVQDKVLARLFHIFYLELTSTSVQDKLKDCITTNDKEQVLNELLNKLAKLQSTHENTDVSTTPNPTESSPATSSPELP